VKTQALIICGKTGVINIRRLSKTRSGYQPLTPALLKAITNGDWAAVPVASEHQLNHQLYFMEVIQRTVQELRVSITDEHSNH